jgi:hypothetical protein
MPITITGDGKIYAPDATEGGYKVIEYGENSNGKYVRFGNGVQICWRTVSPSDASSVTVNGSGTHWSVGNVFSNDSVVYRTSAGVPVPFPASFSSTPIGVDGGNTSSTTGAAGYDSWPVAGVRVDTDNLTHWSFALRAGYSYGGTINSMTYSLIAIGRWYEQ